MRGQVTTNGGSGLSPTYPSLSAAVTALNAATISSPVVITLSGNETAPAGGYNITATGTSTNTITIQGSSSTITAPTPQVSGTLVDAIFKITGGDWITIQNFTMLENASNTTTAASTNNMTEFGVALFYASVTNGAQNCTIQNNTITLNRTYQNTFGIYSNSTHSATNITTSAPATSTAGSNSGLKVYGNAISNVNHGIIVIGSTGAANYNTGIDIGGTASGTGNIITNFGTTATFSGYLNVSGSINGVVVRNSTGFNVSYNSITSSNGGITAASTLRGVYIPAASAAPTGTFTNTINNNTIALTHGFSSGTIQGITVEATTGTATSTQNINNNNFTALGSTVTTSGTITAISNVMPNLVNNFNGNTFTNIISNTTGSFTFFGHSYTMPAGGSQTLNGNSIVTAFSKTGAGGTVTISTSSTSSPNGTTHTFTNNNFSNITVTGATGITGVTNSDGSGSSATRTVTGNTFNNWTGGTSTILGLSYGYIGGTTSTISNNTITNITGQSSITGISIGSSASLATTLNVANNTISNLTSTGTGGAVTGLSCTNASTTININGNAINTLSSTGASSVIALSIGGGATTNVYQNKIYNLLGTNASSTINGILISAGTNINTYNNIIGDLRATAASGNDVIRGISITSTTGTSNQRVYYNTIYLNATSTGTNFGSTGIFHTYNATATTAALDLRNNIIVNASGANGTGLAVAFRRSAATDLNNYASTSNNNLFFGTSGVYSNGSAFAFGSFQTLVGTRETASKFQNPTFASTTGADATFLNFADGAINLAGGTGQVISGYTTDYSGATRSTTLPDMGAFEFNEGTISAPTITSFTPVTICVTGGQSITITGTGLETVSSVLFNGASGVNLPGLITAQSATSLTVTAPANVVDGPIKVTNPGGSVDSSTWFTATPTPTIGVSSNVTICSGQSTTLIATGGATYSWSPATGLSATTGDTVTANPTSTTTYTVTGTSAAGCSATATVTVTVSPAPPAITAAASTTTPCIGSPINLTSTSGSITSSLSEGFETWPPTGWTFVNAGSGNAWATYSTAAGVKSGSKSMYYGYNSSNAADAWAFTPAQNLTAGVTYTISYWYNTGGWSENLKLTVGSQATKVGQTTTLLTQASLTNTTFAQATATFTPSTSGVYYFALNCYSAADQFNLYVDDFAISGSQPATYAWTSSPEGFTSTAQNPTGVVPTVPTTYTVVATVNGCSKSASVTVTPNPLPTIAVENATICNGGTGATLTASGAATYTWSPATGLSATTGTSVTANPTATTTYTITGTDANGCISTTTATVTVNNPPLITAQASNQIVLEGADASYTIEASGTGITYQWQVSTNGTTWSNIEGATNATYNVVAASSADNGKLFQCVVSGTAPCTAVTSNVYTLTVGAVSITSHPANQVVCSNAQATFGVSTTGEVTAYLWQVSTNGTVWTDMANENGSSLVLSGLSATDTGKQYRCVLNNGAVNSDAATLTVFDAIVIGTQPVSQTVCSNAASVTFTSAATGSGVAYKWQVSTNGTAWSDIAGATAATYTINTPGVSLNNNQYRVIVSGTAPCSEVTSDAATLTVNQVVAITTQPVAVTQCSTASTASFSVTATGTGLTYQWEYSTNGSTWNPYVGDTASQSTLTIDAPATYAGNTFRCVVSGTAPCTAVTSNAVTLSISQIMGGTYTVGVGGNYPTLAAAVTAYNNAICFSDNVIFSLTDATYDIGTTAIIVNQNANIGSYTLTVKPAAGVTTSISGAVASNGLLVIKANNVTIDGSNAVGGTTRNLTITNTSTTSPNIIRIASTGTTPIVNTVVKNAILINGSTASSGLIANDATTSANPGYFNGVTIQNNDIQNSFVGVYLNAAGASSAYGTNVNVSSNKIDESGTNKNRNGGIYIAGFNGVTVTNNTLGNYAKTQAENDYGIWIGSYCTNATVTNNTITNLGMTNTSSYYAPMGIYVANGVAVANTVIAGNTISDISSIYGGGTYAPTGIWLAGATAGVTIDSNKVSNIKNNYSSYAYGAYGIRLGSSSTTANVVLKNNMVWDVATYSGTTTLSYNALGIYVSAGAGYKVYNNTVNLGTQLSSSGSVTTAAFAVGSSVSATGALDVRNNIFVNTQTTSSTACYAIYSASANTVFSTIDYNDYWVAGTNVGYLSSARTDLAAIQTGFGGNVNSKTIRPNFVSSSDMHLNVGTNATLDNLGTVLTDVTTDIDGDTRSATPDMGADEFTTLTCASQTLVAGTVTAPISSFCNTTPGTTVSASGYTIGVGMTYQWEMSTNGTTFTGVGTASAIYDNLTTGTLSVTTSYRLAVICDGGSTAYSNVVTLTKNTPAVTAVSANVTICAGQSTVLTASGSGTYAWTPATGLSASTGDTVTAQPTSTTTYTVTGTDANGCSTTATVTVTVNPYPSTVTITQGGASVCTNSIMALTASGGTIGGSGSASLGAGASTSTSAAVNPFYGGYGGVKTQFLIKASELIALGVQAGNINSLGLDITSPGSNLTNLAISVGNTALSAMTTNIETGLTDVYSTASFVPVSGVNTFNFSTPFAWNGTSNIIVSFCWSNNNTSNTASTVKVDAPGFTSSNARYVDSVNAASVCAYTGSTTPSGWNGAATTASSRPKFIFGYSTVTATAITWSPTTELYTNAAATTPYSGGQATVVYVKPTVERIYTATASNGACTTSTTTTVTPLPLPAVVASEDATICNGETTELTVSGADTYVWSPATGLSTTSGNIVTANPSVTTTYTVIGTGANGCQSSDTVTVNVNNPVVVTNQTPEAPVLPGQSTTITVTATGSITGYQWMVSEDSGVSFSNLETSAFYQGVNTNELTISGITFEMSGLVYKCMVSGSLPCGNAESTNYTLKVNSVAVATHPSSTAVCEAGTASFTALGTSSDESLEITYQWEMNSGDGFNPISEGTDASGLTFEGVNAATLNIAGITVTNSGYQFRANINSFINTNAATLTVNNPVVITTAPGDQTVCVNTGTATFLVEATGDNLAYQWQMSTNGTSWSNITGATTTSLTVTNPTASMNGYRYRVVVAGAQSCLSVNSTAAILNVNNPTITSQPTATSVLRGNAATFTVVASVATSYQWQFSVNGTTGWANVATLPTGVTYSGADTATLTVNTSATTATGGAKYYRCIVNNNGCTVTSNAALLTVNWYCTPAPTSVDGTGITNVTMGTINNTTSSETGNYGDYTAQSTSATQLSTVNFSITYATGYAYGTKIWIDFNDNGVFTDAGEQVYYGLSSSANPTTLSGTFNLSLTAPLGAHRMRIGGSDNDAGVDPCYTSTWASFEDYTIIITPAPTCDSTPVAGTAAAANTYVCAGAATNVAVTGETSGVLGISYQWYASTNNVDFTPVASATTATLATAALTEGTYFYCTVTCATSGLSANSNTVFVDVFNPIITATTDAARCGTGTVTLGAEANASATINWYAAATGGASLGTGTTFTTPTIATTTTFYAEAFKGGAIENVGNQGTAQAAEASFSTTSSSDAGIVFTTTKPNVTIKKAYVYVTGTGTLTFTLRNAAGTSIATHTENVTNANSSTAVEVSLPSTFSAATAAAGYRLTMTKTGVTWYYFTGSYPYTSSAVNITSGWGWGTAYAEVRGIHNIDVETGCTSARTAVVATVGQKPTASISYATPFCSSATNANVTLTGTNEYQNGTFSGSEGLSIDSVTGTINVAATTPGTYTVTYTMLPTTYCEAQTATTTVVINQALTSDFAYDAASYCTSQGTVTPVVTGTAGTFTATPAGLSINATTGAINLATSAPGTYTVTNTVSVAGCQNSVSTAVVTVNSAITITSQPANSSVLPGTNVDFTVTATGTGLSYQWQISTDNGVSWSNIEGATASTLSLTAVEVSAQYQVVVSGVAPCPVVTSNVATLTVNTAAIAQHPLNFTACSEGANIASFSVTTTGEATGYQWQVNEGSGWSNITNGGIYADATSATLSLSGLALANNGWQFRCVVNEAVVSNPATLTINTAVALSTQPASTTVCSNGSATFTAAATGTGVAYQWQVSTNGTSWSNVTGATSATLTLNAITPAMNGYQYKVIVSGTSPCSPIMSDVATLTVNTAVAIGTQPVGATVCIDGSATFTVAATGTGLVYQWEMSTNGTSWSPVADATASSLTVSGAQLTMNGYKYRVVVSGTAACSAVTSNAVTLVVDQPAAPVFTPASATICEGNVQTLSVASSSVVQNGVIGTGSVSNTANTPFKGYWGGNKVQYLYTAAELQALGFTNGTVITSIGMDITSFASPYTFNNFTVGMKNTASTALTTTFETGVTTVKNASNYVLSGSAPFTVTLPLDNQFTWNGTSNLVVEFCFNNNNGGGSSLNSADVKSTTTTANLATYYSLDSSATVCSNTTATTSTTRANMRFGVNNGSLVWSPTTGLYTDAAATIPYTGGHATTVYAKPSTTTQYTVTVTNSRGCTNTSSVNVNVLAPATLSSITQPVTTCSGAQTTFSLTGLIPNSTSTIGYAVNNGATQTVTNVVADASGNATFTIALAAFTNGQTLVVKAITRTDVSPNCTTTISANNSVTISVQPTVTYYADADNDGYGDLNTPMITCQGQPAGYVTNNSDCNDANAAIHTTVLYYVDADGDGYGSTTTAMLCSITAPAGYATNNTDCDDANALVWQSASFYVDADADGYDNGSATVCYGATTPVGYATTTNGSDCNDANANLHTPVMYYVDADGDGYGSTTTAMLCSATAPTGYATNNTDCDDANVNIHTGVTYFVDADGDGFGSNTTAVVCALTPPAGYSMNNKDCDDTNPNVWNSMNLFVDLDGDGYSNGTATVCYGNTIPAGYSSNSNGNDCDDANALVWQSASFYVDADGDGYTSGSATVCYGATIPAGYLSTANGSDCDDANALVWQSASLYVDADADGYDNGSATVCYGATIPVGYATTT
ncbi:beta strand repeat-containing protein, partial [Flavobacterium sp.]|uniref:beta strand repeat-containing protein n=1 Tax=Flavobacterium sp. TaxID=239 RepID=UPI0037C005B7